MTSTIIFKTDSEKKILAQKIASELGLSLTSVINGFIDDFIQNKSVSFGAPKIKYLDPFGLMPGKFISQKQIKKPALDWQKRIQQIG